MGNQPTNTITSSLNFPPFNHHPHSFKPTHTLLQTSNMRFTFAATFAALAAVGSVAAQTVPYATEPAAVDVEILQYALTLEHLEAKFYSEALGKFSDADFEAAGYGAQVRQRIGEIAVHEATHVTTLASVITAAGATPTAPCVYDFPYTDIPSFLALSAILEDVGVSAYLYKAQFINEKAYLTAAASILAVEARHQATVSTFQATDPIPSPPLLRLVPSFQPGSAVQDLPQPRRQCRRCQRWRCHHLHQRRWLPSHR